MLQYMTDPLRYTLRVSGWCN